jgi:rhamnulokinase/L-fuculokinase
MKILAFDFGASSGRAMAATVENGKIKMEEIHRFSNDPVQVGETFYWDVCRLYHEIKQSLMKAGAVDSVGIDTWGVDFGLLDESGRLMGNPRHYRDTAYAKVAPGFLKKSLKKRFIKPPAFRIFRSIPCISCIPCSSNSLGCSKMPRRC